MMEQGFRGNCDFQGKLGMCPSLAESDSGGFPRILPAARSCKNYGVLYDFHTVFIDTHQQECYNIDVHRKNEFR